MQSIIDLRREQERGAVNLASTLRSVELNVTEFCNRTCSFCPRGTDLYPNGKSKMMLDTAYNIARGLIRMGFNGRIGIVGFGEPLAYPGLAQLIRTLRIVDAKWIEVNTNGDFLTRKVIEELYAAGCTNISVSMYDKDISDILFDMVKGIPIELTPRHHYKEKFELQLVNRIEILDQVSTPNTTNKPCYLPFYKMFVDWNGDVLVCNNDWGRRGIVGNVNKQDIGDIWMSDELQRYRYHLQVGNRSKCTPCNRCNIDGTKFGKESFDLFQEAII